MADLQSVDVSMCATDKTRWTLENSVELIRILQPLAHQHGYHLALAGGILNKGYSEKDLDVVALPRSEMEQDWPDFQEAVEDVLDTPLVQLRAPQSAYPLEFKVYVGKHTNGRIDVIRHEREAS
jgi:hypothetical protein